MFQAGFDEFSMPCGRRRRLAFQAAGEEDRTHQGVPQQNAQRQGSHLFPAHPQHKDRLNGEIP